MPYFCVFFVGFFRDGTRNSSEISYIIHRQTSKSRYSAISFVFVGRNRGPWGLSLDSNCNLSESEPAFSSRERVC